MSKEDIIQEAKDAYQKVFKDQEKRNSQDEENEVIFNQTELKKEIQEMKEKEEQKHKTLEALRHCIHEKAGNLMKRHFMKIQINIFHLIRRWTHKKCMDNFKVKKNI